MPVLTDTPVSSYTPVRAPRGNQLSCKGWAQEAAMRMLMNNLDPDVAERPQDLVVYGGTGRAARNWDCYHAIVRSLKSLENDETLLVQSGKPVGIFRTHEYAPRVLHLQLQPGRPLVELGEVQRTGEARPHHVRPDDGRLLDLHRLAGNHPGNIRDFRSRGREAPRRRAGRQADRLRRHGRNERRAAAGRDHDGRVLSSASKSIPSASRSACAPAIATSWSNSLDEALRILKNAVRKKENISVGLVGNCGDIIPELAERGVVPDILTDQTSAHDPLNGYVPSGMTLEEALELRKSDPKALSLSARSTPWRATSKACSSCRRWAR